MPIIHAMPCPLCGTFDLTRSRRRGIEYFIAWLGIFPYRCLRCDLRCYRREGLPRAEE